MPANSVSEAIRILQSVGMDYERLDQDTWGFERVKVFRQHPGGVVSGLVTFGSGKTLLDALKRAMLGQPIDWLQTKDRMHEKDCMEIMHL